MRLLFTLFVFFTVTIINGQNISANKFEHEIYILNNKREFEKSITRIYEVLDDPKSTYYDQYIAYLQKSYTYKRVYNYTEAFNNLTLALEAGLRTDRKKEVKTKIAIERFFIVFDLQKHDQVKDFIEANKELNLDIIDRKTKGLYLAALAIVDINNGQYQAGDEKINVAIDIFKSVAPEDLPNIYAKKMYLYQTLGDSNKVDESYKDAIFYAEKYNSPFYIKNLAINMWKYYTDLGDGQKAKEYKRIVDNINYDDISSFNLTSIRLTELEKKIQYNNQEISRQKDLKKTVMLIVISIVAIIVLVTLIITYQKSKSKRKSIEFENTKMRKVLEQMLQTGTQESYNEKIEFESSNLTDRQKQVIELVKLGKTNKEIANELFISENTVKYHLKIIYNILKIENRTQLQE